MSQNESVVQERETIEYWHIGAQDRSQVIWQSNDRGIIGSGDHEIGWKGKKVKGKR